MAKIVEARNLKYRYPDGTIGIENVDFELWQGERVAIIGPNGSGKSTLLQLIGGLILPTEGKIKFFGKESIDSYELRQKMGILLQNPDDVLFNPTVREDLEFGPAQLEIEEKEFKQTLDALIKMLNLGNFLEKPPFRLSEGQKQRIALGCILTMKPEVLLLDEPFSAVDAKTRHSMIGHLNKLNKEGVTIVVTAHDTSFIPLIADRIYLLNKQVIAQGAAREILTNVELLDANGLEVPPLVEFAIKLRLHPIPLTVDEAVESIKKLMEN
jgi:cobalt/nickel transport system ATP-binding protein